MQGGICQGGGTGGHVLVTEFRGMALNDLFCADVLRPLDLVPITDFTYKYHPGHLISSSNAITLYLITSLYARV